MKKDLHYKTLVFCGTIIGAVCAVFWDKILLISLALLLFLIFSLYKKHFGKIFSTVTLIIFLLTIYYSNVRQADYDTLSLYDGKSLTLTCTVSSAPEETLNGKTRFICNTNSILTDKGINENVRNKTLVYYNKTKEPIIIQGDIVKVYADIMIPKSYSNPGEFDYGKYLKNQDIYTLSFAKKIEQTGLKPTFKNKCLQNINEIREKIIQKHLKYLGKEKTELLGGIVFGSEAIKPSAHIKNIFIESGLYHLLAASGMNVAFIFGIWFFILIRLKLPYKFIIISGGLVVLFYSFMTGLPPSVTRATWMLELALLGKLLDRQADNNVILLFVCAVLLIYDPKLINDIGFLLSFIITFGLINFANQIMELMKFLPPKISGWFIIPLIAQVFAIPVQIYYFQYISIYSIFANMLVVPFMAVISFCGFISSILALIPKIGSYMCMFLDKINEPFLAFMLLVADKFSAIPNNIAEVAKWNYIEIILYYVLTILFIYMLKNKFKNIKINLATFLVFICLLCSFFASAYSNELEFVFFNVGEGDSIFIKTPNNKKILVDTGKYYGRYRNSGNSVIMPYFKVNGIKSIDMMILTHPDTDHIAGSVDILENIKIDKLITNGEKADNISYKKLSEYIAKNKIKEYVVSDVQNIFTDEDLSITAIKPKDVNKHSQNDTSVILLVKYKDFDGVLMGDNEINSYEVLKKELKPNGRIELFKLGHHGSEKSIDAKMSKLINPEITIISVGKNKYGHPSPDIFGYLSNSKIYRTDIKNTIKVKTDGENNEIYSYNADKSCWNKEN